ncbi:hypothetical protein RJ639_039227 [Escallonia herrerae]|uniref:Uncharacterized protein n=1 Tax=Escallonia herrerae TaxID=1293975 RepID=A0AA89B7C2_9ASTE|nr:hypothetical protein RJ639_039227 [Escallonia herrerae]
MGRNVPAKVLPLNLIVLQFYDLSVSYLLLSSAALWCMFARSKCCMLLVVSRFNQITKVDRDQFFSNDKAIFGVRSFTLHLRGAYKNLLDAFVKIVQEEGPAELYRGLTPSLIGVIPYAATSYFAYDTLRKAYKKAFNQEDIGNLATLLIGSAAGAISSTATFPLEVARKHMQAGAINGRQYHNMLHALICILEKEGVAGLYRGLGPSCVKLVPAAGISFMCYEACKRILVENEDEP